MGVLDPLLENTSEMQRMKEKYHGMIEMSIDNYQKFAGAILNNRYDVMEDENAFFFKIDDKDPMDMSTEEEIDEEVTGLQLLKESLSLESLKNKYGEIYAKKLDTEADFENPIESYEELDNIDNTLDNLIDFIDTKLIEKEGLNRELVETDMSMFDYNLSRSFYTLTDSFQALPLIEGIVNSKENIQREKENILAKAVDEHREHKDRVVPEYDRVESIPVEPVDWEEVIEEESIQDFMDISDISMATYGDTLHMMMEEICEGIEGLEPEYPLHFTNKGEPDDTPIENRIDNTVRPDAVDDLFVYEFKHMPREQFYHLEQNGDLQRDQKFVENIDQLNGYLNDLELPVGMLVYISSDMDVKEYVVEQHSEHNDDLDYIEEHIHEKEDYDFSEVASQL